MTMPPMAQRLRDYILGIQKEAERHQPIQPELAAVANWLRGNTAALDSLVKLLHYRVEGRAQLPVSSNPHEVLVDVGRDREAREFARLLSSLYSSPVSLGSTEEYERGSQTDRGPGS